MNSSEDYLRIFCDSSLFALSEVAELDLARPIRGRPTPHSILQLERK